MNHPRRLLLLLPIALLGAACFMRSRVPHPSSEGDKWLWEQAETTSSLAITFGHAGRSTAQRCGLDGSVPTTLSITNRQGIRELLRALKSTLAFMPLSSTIHLGAANPYNTAVVVISLGKREEFLYLSKEPNRYSLYRQHAHLIAPLDQQSATRFLGILRTDVAKARQHQDGYSLMYLVG